MSNGRRQPLTRNLRPGGDPPGVREYERSGGYEAVRKTLGRIEPAAVIQTVKDANLRGRGGAGFNTGLKWSFVPLGPDAPRPKYLVCNADEMEPGTFKDRYLMEGDPHELIEGMILAGYAIQATTGWIFLREEYRRSRQCLERALAEARDAAWLGTNIAGSGFDFDIRIHVSAGRYMCGEETGLLNALEGKRANPRSKPPFPQTSGAWGRPTIVQNVETLCNVPHILLHGAEWFRSLSLTADGGTKLYGASGKVRRPGLWELPMGTPLREILEEHAGGMREGLELRGLLPGGGSTDFLTPEHLDVPMDFNELQKFGSRMGTGTIIVLDDKTCPVGMVRSLEKFFAQESCGWCTPCREGLPWAREILDALEDGNGAPGDLEMLEHLCRGMAPGLTYCALAPGAAEPLQSALRHFRGDFERHIREHRCPWRDTK